MTTLFDAIPAHVKRSSTSRAAAESVVSITEAGRRAMLSAIKLAGEHGMTDAELETLLERPGNWIRPRRRELEKAGWIRDSGRTRPTTSGRMAVVWEEVKDAETSSPAGVPHPAQREGSGVASSPGGGGAV